MELLLDRIAIVINRGTAIRLQAEEVALRDQSCKMGKRIIEGFALEHRHASLVEGWRENARGLQIGKDGESYYPVLLDDADFRALAGDINGDTVCPGRP